MANESNGNKTTGLVYSAPRLYFEMYRQEMLTIQANIYNYMFLCCEIVALKQTHPDRVDELTELETALKRSANSSAMYTCLDIVSKMYTDSNL